MKKFVAALAMVFCVSAFAHEEIMFSYSGMESWGASYYACSYAEAQTQKHLKTLGAINPKVRCFGGIKFGMSTPVRVMATFDVPMPSGRDEATRITIKGEVSNPSCGLNVAIMKAILPKFSQTVSVIKKNDSCSFYRSNYSYDLAIDK